MFNKISIVILILSVQIVSAEYTVHMAQNHIGEKATVCGEVVSTHYASSSRGEPTFLNLDEAYPEHIFTAVIWGENREKFDEPEVTYSGQTICVTGKIKSYRGTTQIVIYSQKQVRVK
jgi:DNA/RNA endonuclease YhcR with UshA esterase domain